MFGPPWKILGAPLPSPTSTSYHHSSTHHYYYPPPLPTTTRPEPSPTSTSYHHPSTHHLPPPTTATRPEPATTSISYHHSSTHHYSYPVVLPTSTTRHRPSSTTSTPAAFGPPCGVPQAGRRQTAPSPPPTLPPQFPHNCGSESAVSWEWRRWRPFGQQRPATTAQAMFFTRREPKHSQHSVSRYAWRINWNCYGNRGCKSATHSRRGFMAQI